MSLNRIKELRQKRCPLIEQASVILTTAAEEDRDMTPEQETEFEKLHKDADGILKEVTRLERQLAADASIKEIRLASAAAGGRTPDEQINLEQRETREFSDWMRGGVRGVREADQDILKRMTVSPGEIRGANPQTVTTTAGGHLIPVGFQAELDRALLEFGGMRQAARIITTATGNQLDWPTVTDTSNVGELLLINAAVTVEEIVYGQVVFNAYKYSSKAVKVPVELMQDSAFPIDAHVKDILAERLGRITNTHFTVGTGSSQPNGIVTAAADSGGNFSVAELAAGTATAAIFGDLLDLEHSIDPAYRAKATWMFQDDFLQAMKKLVDGNARPLFRSADAVPGGIDTLMGYPFTINQDVPSSGTSTNKAVLFGDMKKFIIRIVRPMVMLRLDERYADNHQIGFFAFERADSDIVDASGGAVKYSDMVA